MTRFSSKIELPVEAQTLWDWHVRRGAFARLAPPWQRIEILEDDGAIAEGSRLAMRLGLGPLGITWVARHEGVEPPREFTDVQERGPFAAWRHRHRIVERGEGRSALLDEIDYELPFGAIGRRLGGRFVAADLERLFGWRHRVLAHDLMRHEERRIERRPRVALSGAGGLLGRALAGFLRTGGYEVVPIVRGDRERLPDAIAWDTTRGRIDPLALSGVDAVVHLAGESIASGRWNEDRRERILRSRVEGTRSLVEALAEASPRPRTLVCASAVGFYGDLGAGAADEGSPSGTGFLAEVCRRWEEESRGAETLGLRVVNARFGMVLSPAGGALRSMLGPFRLGLGGRVGSGEQSWSWIALDDAVAALHRILIDDGFSGPVNVAAPGAVTAGAFARTLGLVMRRPAILPAPAFALRLALGEMADELLLSGCRALPTRLAEGGFAFAYPELEPALRHLLGRPGAPTPESLVQRLDSGSARRGALR